MTRPSDERELAQRWLLTPLADVRRRARLYLVLNGLAQVASWIVALGLAQLVLDRWLRFSLDQRAVLTASILLVLGWVVFRRLLLPLRNPLSDRDLAARVDRRHPELADQITSAVEFSRGRGDADFNSPELVGHVIHEACEKSKQIAFIDVLNHRRGRRRALDIGVWLAVVAAAWIVMPTTMSTWFQRNVLLRPTPWPQSTYIVPRDFDAQHRRLAARGDELVIVADTQGIVPRSATLHWRDATGRRGDQPMALIGESGWRASLGVLTDGVTFHITGGDEHTPDYAVAAVDRPRVRSITASITPPPYTRQTPVQLDQQTVLEMPSGSTVVIDAALNKPVTEAELVGEQGAVGECRVVGPGEIRWRSEAPASGAYAFDLVDEAGFRNRAPVRVTLKVHPDAPPELECEAPGVLDIVTPASRFSVNVIAVDNFGLSRLACSAQRDDQPPLDLPLERIEPGDMRAERSVAIDLAALGAEPGERFRVAAEAADTDPAGPNVTRSDPIVLRVLSTTDFAAELAKRELELRQEFERLISAQRGLNELLIQLLPSLPENEPPPAAPAQQIAGLLRRQETVAQRTGSIADRFEVILRQMRIGQIARAGDERRIAEGVVEPLRRLSGVDMPEAVRGLARLRERVVPVDARDTVRQQAEIVREMRDVLERMLEWEGYREAVALLTDIIDQQSGIHEATVDALEGQLEDILGLEIPLEQSPGDPPKP